MSSSRKIAISSMKLSPEAEAAAYRIREMEDQLEANPYFQKYAPKLESLKQNRKGLKIVVIFISN